MSPCQGRHIIHGIPNRDQNWREEFFVFKIDEAFLGSFDFSRLPRYWAEDICKFLFCTFECAGGLLMDFFVRSSSFGEIGYDRRAWGFNRSS